MSPPTGSPAAILAAPPPTRHRPEPLPTACVPRRPGYNGARLAGGETVTGVIAASALLCLTGLLGLLMAALAADPAARVMGIGLVVLAWLAMLAYHGRRAERQARAKGG